MLVILGQQELGQPRKGDAYPIPQAGIVYAAAWKSPDEGRKTDLRFVVHRKIHGTRYLDLSLAWKPRR